MRTPVYRPIFKYTRQILNLYDVVNDGINPSFYAFAFTLGNLPNSSDFANLYDLFRITKVEIDWVPEYTELTDAALVSNAVNVRFSTAVDISDNSAPTSVDQLMQYQNVKSTGITKPHSRVFEPAVLMSGQIPCSCMVPTSFGATQFLGIKVAVPPCGVAMTFRSRVKVHLECANVN